MRYNGTEIGLHYRLKKVKSIDQCLLYRMEMEVHNGGKCRSVKELNHKIYKI
jgi:hypothetical protein